MPSGCFAPRVALLNNTFWQVLPSHYDKIKARWEKIARLYNQARFQLLATDRDGASNSLKAELEMLEHDLKEYRDIAKGIDITDMAGMYVTAGKSPHEALQEAKEDLEDLESSLRLVEERMAEVKADIVYGLSEER